MPNAHKPLIAVLDGSIAVTGALKAVAVGANLLAGETRTLLILPEGSLVSPSDVPACVDLVFAPLPMLRRSVASLLTYLPATLRSALHLKRLLKERQVKTLQVNDFYLLPGFLVRPLGWKGRIVAMLRIDTRRFGLAGRLWLNVARRWSDRLCAVSRFIADTVGGAPSPMVLLNPVENVSRRTDIDGPRPPRLVFISNYIRGKGQDTAIRAFQRAAADFPDAELHFHGGDMGLAKNVTYRRELEALAASGAGAQQIRFHDFTTDTAAILDGARAALVLSHSESFSLTCQEASAHGVPVIATRCGGPAEIVEDGVTGFLIAVEDDEAAADRMRRLLRDPELAEAMGQRGAALMQERFSPERWVREVRPLLGLPDPVSPAL
ncbi:glycosyltransferase family 4 protein [Sphingomonas sp. KRR8]|uniref:glycosyltransferase family 4 protein n=1 Tax=Sphingomonas sp. KRR8 TaxID=2942996 RepID=UPI0020221FA8|nr:glycosyltransferase family 4 protein [Sphingomonas sp. KRR8]URD61583.1 glycosyltransferase family 4 protein [Sphingomonas sp. KRR8]